MGTRIKPQPPQAHPRLRLINQLASTRAGAWFFVHVANRLDRVTIPLTRGRVRTTLTLHTVVLHHRGARSGLPRTTPLVYFTDGADVVLVASNGGAPHNPAWYHNPLAHPDVTLTDGANTGPYQAQEAIGDQRRRLWEAAVTMYPGWATYQTRTAGRHIPVMVLRPTS
ncbi:MAG TPA: nitroreductase/quinone reductase family protein [Sporichthyaceae bacterium]|nr:nitroreductase/quinone reductase family protein [Sporichthyaceae bacterium]